MHILLWWFGTWFCQNFVDECENLVDKIARRSFQLDADTTCSPYANVTSNKAKTRNDDGFFEKYDNVLKNPTQDFLTTYYSDFRRKLRTIMAMIQIYQFTSLRRATQIVNII